MRRKILQNGTLGMQLAAVAAVMALGWMSAAPADAASRSRKLTDRSITEAIEDELLFDQGVPLNEIAVKTTMNGVVTLSGTVDNLLAKERAVKIAETVRGVRSVIDKIEVDPYWGRSDWQIEQDTEEALLRDTATDSWEIEVDVEDNRATLTGTVESWQEKNLAGTVVKGVRGVEAIDNLIAVDYATERSDYQIQQDIEERLRWDVLVDDALIDVKVSDGKVRLDGTVGSAAEKRQAYWDAWVAGVESVRNDGLEVKYWARDERLRKKKYVAKPDDAIRKAVEDALLYDPRVNSLEVDTFVDDGFVTLRGEVDSVKAKRSAKNDARNTVGVLGVKNRIRVRTSTPTPEQLKARIEDAVAQDPYLERYEIEVAVFDQDAYLAGDVDSYFEKSRAENVVSSIYGVEEIHNLLDVEYDLALVYDPYVYEFDPYAYAWYDYEPINVFTTDAEIREEIDDEMWWSPYVDADEVDVQVEDGVATLTGTVDTLFEMDNAVEEAYEGGASWVSNKITVE